MKWKKQHQTSFYMPLLLTLGTILSRCFYQRLCLLLTTQLSGLTVSHLLNIRLRFRILWGWLNWIWIPIMNVLIQMGEYKWFNKILDCSLHTGYLPTKYPISREITYFIIVKENFHSSRLHFSSFPRLGTQRTEIFL